MVARNERGLVELSLDPLEAATVAEALRVFEDRTVAISGDPEIDEDLAQDLLEEAAGARRIRLAIEAAPEA